jgi:hypothetical protein
MGGFPLAPIPPRGNLDGIPAAEQEAGTLPNGGLAMLNAAVTAYLTAWRRRHKKGRPCEKCHERAAETGSKLCKACKSKERSKE